MSHWKLYLLMSSLRFFEYCSAVNTGRSGLPSVPVHFHFSTPNLPHLPVKVATCPGRILMNGRGSSAGKLIFLSSASDAPFSENSIPVTRPFTLMNCPSYLARSEEYTSELQS